MGPGLWAGTAVKAVAAFVVMLVTAFALLLLINLFNYIDRQVLAAVVPQLKASFFGYERSVSVR